MIQSGSIIRDMIQTLVSICYDFHFEGSEHFAPFKRRRSSGDRMDGSYQIMLSKKLVISTQYQKLEP